ncbi:O-antigen ligase family protein [Oricola sp.]|uniref:O-antigen ligase family protein n=1 Tax=Oricola sp. TaxID=1979950 RepID=UPI003BACCE11
MKPAIHATPRYAGPMILTTLVLGGGAGQGLWTEHLVQLMLMPALFLGLAGFGSNRLSNPARIATMAVIAVLCVQFIPVTRPIPLVGEGEPGFWSLTPQRSLESALFTIGTVGFFLFVASMDDRNQQRCIPFFYAGLCLQTAIAVVQLSYGQTTVLTGLLPYDVYTGLFANENHFSSLVIAMMPLLAFTFIVQAKNPAGYATVCALLVMILFAVGSRAGMALSAAMAVLSLVWFALGKGKRRLKLSALAIGIAGLGGCIWAFDIYGELGEDRRFVIFETTWTAILQYWPLGSGLGSFPLVYPGFEQTTDITTTYINHAHNDYLEVVLELGAAGVVLIAGYFLLVSRNMFNSKLAQAASLSIIVLSLHSIIDYPMRTMSLALTFAFLSACALSQPSQAPEKTSRRSRSRPGNSHRVEIPREHRAVYRDGDRLPTQRR